MDCERATKSPRRGKRVKESSGRPEPDGPGAPLSCLVMCVGLWAASTRPHAVASRVYGLDVGVRMVMCGGC